jgi:hypothetical protein
MPPLFLFAGSRGRLPSGSLLAWRRGDDLDLLFLGLLVLAIASLLAFGHNDLLCLDGDAPIAAASHLLVPQMTVLAEQLVQLHCPIRVEQRHRKMP